MIKTVGIVGLGLIGGSFAHVIKMRSDARICGLDIDPVSLAHARRDGVIDEILDIPVGLAECDLLILALRPHDAAHWIGKHIEHTKKTCIIFDVAGVKRYVSEHIGALCARHGRRFVGAHPMAGFHEGGYGHASASLFEGASFIVCKDDHTDQTAVDELCEFIKGLGFAQIVLTTAQNHDEMIAFTSQLAHIVSNAYIKDPDAKAHAGYSAGSFQDMTRVAILDAEMWSELFIENSDNLLKHLDTLINHLVQYREALDSHDDEMLRYLLQKGVDAKRATLKASGEG